MEEILKNSNKIIIDKAAQGQSGVLPYLPLPNLLNAAPPTAAPAAAPRRARPRRRRPPPAACRPRRVAGHESPPAAWRRRRAPRRRRHLGDELAVHRRSDRAGAGVPVRPAAPGDPRPRPASEVAVHRERDRLRQARARFRTAARGGHRRRPEAAGRRHLHPLPHHRPAAVLPDGRHRGGGPRPA